jgi:glycosyltransferase involved in cell wall biosynthesis
MMINKSKTAILHYSAPPTVGGVESVINAHAKVFIQEGYPVKIIAGNGEKDALPRGTELVCLPSMNSQNEKVLQINKELEKGIVSDSYYELRDQIKVELERELEGINNVIVHNIFSKHFNLPLTEALHQLLDEKKINNCIAWCHDFSWASAHSKQSLHDGQPWDLLRTFRLDVQYVVVSKKRQQTLAEIFDVPRDNIKVVYNGIGPKELMGASHETNALIKKVGLDSADLIMLMPVRITQAKNIEFAMHVVASLHSEDCNTILILTGPPDPHDSENMAYFKELRKLRMELGIENHFRFLYEENPTADEPYILDMKIVNELYRVCDLVFIPSHREGFGMPVLEAGFSGKPVFASNIPAAEEIGGGNIHQIDLDEGSQAAAEQILDWAAHDSVFQLRQQTRQKYTWLNIFRNRIQPMLIDQV